MQAAGTLRRTKTGEASLFVERMAVLAKALNPPPEKWHGLTDVEARLRERYLDLIVNEEVQQIFRTRAKIVTAMRRFLDDRGFLEVETPTLQPIVWRRVGAAVCHPSQPAAPGSVPAHRRRAVPQAADRRRLRARL